MTWDRKRNRVHPVRRVVSGRSRKRKFIGACVGDGATGVAGEFGRWWPKKHLRAREL